MHRSTPGYLPANPPSRNLDGEACLTPPVNPFFQMGLIPRIESVQDFCSESDIDSFRRFRCAGLAAELRPQETLPEMCEGLIKSMSARINNGAVGD